MSNELNLLRRALEAIPNGPAPEGVRSLLQDAWPEIIGSEQHKTTADKLSRIENLRWDRPILSFTIERHGGTVMGSTRAELHDWEVNVETGQARCGAGRYRQVGKRAAKLDVRTLVDEVIRLVESGADSPKLKWLSPIRFRMYAAQFIPDEGPQETIRRRRKRFSVALQEELKSLGWFKVSGKSSHVYEKLAE